MNISHDTGTLALALARPLGMTLLFPLLQPSVLGGALIRNGVLLAFMLPALPLVAAVMPAYPDWTWVPLIPGELLAGILLGFCAAVPFWAVDMAGFLIDTLRGATLGVIFNPSLTSQTSLLGLLFSQVLCVLFFAGEGMHFLLTALYRSLRDLPPGSVWLAGHHIPDFLRTEWDLLWQLCMAFSLPVVLSMVLIDLAMGLINRSAQQLHVFSLAMPVKSAVALFLLILILPHAFQACLHQRSGGALQNVLSVYDRKD